MKAKLFEYAVLWHPTDKQIKDEGKKTIVIAGPKPFLARDEKAAGMAAVMDIPADYREQIDQIEIAIRPF